ncbi:hypothetical protein BDR07DRAFT_1372322 [Suillus spraguei]|nr:hypothetical protein BDR07DRAFT_1372322 [Suillus spraguei]
MSGLEEYDLYWNDNTSVATITLISYEYILQFDKEVTFVWVRAQPRRYEDSELTGYAAKTVARYFGIIVTIGFQVDPNSALLWHVSVHAMEFFFILIWRLYVLYNKSKLILYVLLGFFLPIVALYIAVDIILWSRHSAISVQEIIITPHIKYCTAFFHIGPMTAIYSSIPVICFDIFLVVLAIVVLKKHLKEQKELKMKPNTYVVMIVRYHVIYFVLNLATQICMATVWAHTSVVVLNLVLLFKCTAPIIIVPRLIISIWDTHAKDDCVHVSTTFEDCVCLTSPPDLELPEIA